MASTGSKDSTGNQPVNLSEETKKVVKAMNLFYEALDPVSKPTEQVRETIHQAVDLIDRIGNLNGQVSDLNGRICKEMRRVNQDSYRVHKLNVDIYRKYFVERRAHMRTKETLQEVVAFGYELIHFLEDQKTEHDEEETTEDGSDGHDEDGHDEHCE